MIFRYEYHGGVWVDIEQPTDEEIRLTAQEFAIDERIEMELLSPNPTPLATGDGASALLVLHFPANGEHDETKNQEVDIVVSKKFIVTVRYEVIAPFYHLKKLLEARTLLAHHESITTDILLEIIFAHLYAAVRDHTNHIASRLEHVEREMFNGHDRTTVRAISNISREFLHMESALANQEGPLARFLKMIERRNFFDTAFDERAERILSDCAQVNRLVTAHRAVATELRETNAALLEVRQNQIMKVLTVAVVCIEIVTLLLTTHWLF